MSLALDVIDGLIDDTVRISSKIMNVDEVHELLQSQTPAPPGLLGPSPYQASIRSMFNSAAGQRLALLKEVKDAVMHAEIKVLEDQAEHGTVDV